ncbi:hypothetical protein CLIB1444_02S00826 [[Candida] jaroonii]|uniref:Uncharacterized protein n=1 Tax=[Candida] jaroonii TaxID=467808 RepID=A0ACA9Y295_9ASCO|nr:hypothetical protein CLIB1444_02S00826 [[Candida] jaroonii]
MILPLELVREVFEYLPIDTNELMGEGDGGLRRWNELKQLRFVITNHMTYNHIFDQFRRCKYHKIIQLVHSSPKSLVDCYYRPPFFPDGAEVIIDPEDMGVLTEYEPVFKRFRVNLETKGNLEVYEQFCHLWPSLKPSKVEIYSFDDLEYLIDFEVDSLVIHGAMDIPKFHYANLRKLEVDITQWLSDYDRYLNLEELIINIGDRRDPSLDVNIPTLKSLKVKAIFPLHYLRVKLPPGLLQLFIDADVNILDANLPDSLIEFLAERVEEFQNSGTDGLPPFLEKLDIAACPTNSTGRWRSNGSGLNELRYHELRFLRHLTVKNDPQRRELAILSLPDSLESLNIIKSVKLAVKFDELPKFRELTIAAANFLDIFEAYEENSPSLANAWTVEYASKTYCIPFSKSLESFCVSRFPEDMRIICFPQSLKHIDVFISGPSFFEKLPVGLKSLRINNLLGSDSKINLPPNLELLQIMNSDLENLKYERVKHLFLHYADSGYLDFEEVNLPKNLKTLGFIQRVAGTTIDLSDTNLTKFSCRIDGEKDSESLYSDEGEIIKEDPCHIIMPPSLSLLDVPTGYGIELIIDLSKVNMNKLRAV